MNTYSSILSQNWHWWQFRIAMLRNVVLMWRFADKWHLSTLTHAYQVPRLRTSRTPTGPYTGHSTLLAQRLCNKLLGELYDNRICYMYLLYINAGYNNWLRYILEKIYHRTKNRWGLDLAQIVKPVKGNLSPSLFPFTYLSSRIPITILVARS